MKEPTSTTDVQGHLSFPVHGHSVVTCLIFSQNRIISASDDSFIKVYSPVTGALLHSLEGHEGGVWALAASKDTLVSSSTDRTIRIWNLSSGACNHVFGGHTSTVRCLTIVKPEWIDVISEDGATRREKWPKRPLIVTGSRDKLLRVWDLPREGDAEFKYVDDDYRMKDASDNPYHRRHLEGHSEPVRAVAAHGRTAVSGSYDYTVRVWDITTGECKWVLAGHKDKVYDVVFDPGRNQIYSSSMDMTIRLWNLQTGQCQHTLTGHTSLVGILRLSCSHLVSAAADSTLRIWDPDTGKLQNILNGHGGAITCFQHDEAKLVSGSDGTLKLWNLRDGTVIKDLITGVTGVWNVVFDGRWCAAASNRDGDTMLDIWDFSNDKDWLEEPSSKMDDENSEEEE